jgi:phosphatidylglycerol---prolipoprotein diacylglyceryl transferase
VLPEIDLLGLPLKTFGLMFALAFVASGIIVGRRLVELERPVDWAYEIVFAALAGGLVGSRLHYLVESWSELEGGFVENLFSGSGLVWYGGAVGGAVAVMGWARWRGMLGVRLLDLCAPALAAGYAVGRVGCQISGDGDYGVASNVPWAMAYPEGVVPTTEEVHPTPIYETLAMGLAALVLWRARDRLRPGGLFALYLVFAGVERFLVEFIRRNPDAVAGLTAPQLQSVALALAGGTWLVVLHRGGGVRRPPALAA